MGIKLSCFAYSKGKNECNALTELVCEKKNCSFYMTMEQYREKMKKTAQKDNIEED